MNISNVHYNNVHHVDLSEIDENKVEKNIQDHDDVIESETLNQTDAIRLNSYDVSACQSDISPSVNVINLNDYYNAGFKSDEQNSYEAVVIRQDIMSKYDIDSQDLNANEKISEVYKAILEDISNEPLQNYLEINNIPIDSHSDEFNTTVETVLAHMSHDGSSIGDIVNLKNVDFSDYFVPLDVSYTDKPKIVINNYRVLEFDSNILQDKYSYKGLVNGKKTIVHQKDDGTCVVNTYSKSDNSKIESQTKYTPDALVTTTTYTYDNNGKQTVNKLTTQTQEGTILSEYTNLGSFGIEVRFGSANCDYSLYDEDGKHINTITSNVDEYGIVNIATYSDSDKTVLLSNDYCLQYNISDNEIKYKFSTGNENSVDIIDNGSELSVNISRGNLNQNYVITQNSKGLYEFNDKQYYSKLELAAALNQIEPQPTEKVDGIISVSKQGFGVGDCGVISALNALSYTEYGKQVLDECFIYNDDGSMTINFYGINRAYNVSKDEIDNTDYFSQGDKEMKALEVALTRAYSEIVYGNLYISDYSPFWCRTPWELTSEPFLITANWPQSVFHMLTGKYCSEIEDPDYGTKQQWLNELQNCGGIAISCATALSDGTYVLVHDTSSCYVPGRTVYDAFGNPTQIVSSHAYAVKEVNSKDDLNRVVTIVNPWDSSKEIVLDESTYLNLFELCYSMQIRNNENYPIYYS